ncbi:MAG TPA: hypothetical protein VFN61_05495 [Acidimicrobiales bacterium]|nr:hypothetical protein [Acidimicrobiales bacterium]
MATDDELEERIRVLRSQLAPPPEMVAKDQDWRVAQAAYRAAQGTPAEQALYEQFRHALNQRNRVALPWVLRSLGEGARQIEYELRKAEMELAKRRTEPYLVPVEVDGTIVGLSAQERIEIRPELSGSGELFVQSELGPPAVVFLAGARWGDDDGHRAAIGWVLMTFTVASPMARWGVTQAKFGYPNEEAFKKNPPLAAGFAGIGLYEMMNSPWPGEIVAFNMHNFPDTPGDPGLRHFMLVCKENTLEVVCAGFQLELVEGTLEDAVRLYLSRY